MGLKNFFKRVTGESIHNSSQVTLEADVTSSDNSNETTWDSLTKLNRDAQSATTFDDLANVPFAGNASATDGSVAPEQRLQADVQRQGPTETLPTNNEQHESASSPEVQAFKNLFAVDLRVKRGLIEAAPTEYDESDEQSRMDYVDQAYRTFKDFRDDFAQIEHDFNLGTGDLTDQFFHRGEEGFALSNYGPGATKQIYRKEFSDLRSSFVEQVKQKCVGYYLFSNLPTLINQAQTVNELLHAYHSYIMNNENILRRVPAIDEKTVQNGDAITLRGDESELSRQVFDAVPEDTKLSSTDIIAAGDNVMMMVRGSGHALTIQAEPDHDHPDQMWVRYNIPKPCNFEMIKALPGIIGYTEHGASGGFLVPRDGFGTTVIDFVNQVPTDKDMFKEGGTHYHPSPQQTIK